MTVKPETIFVWVLNFKEFFINKVLIMVNISLLLVNNQLGAV